MATLRCRCSYRDPIYSLWRDRFLWSACVPRDRATPYLALRNATLRAFFYRGGAGQQAEGSIIALSPLSQVAVVLHIKTRPRRAFGKRPPAPRNQNENNQAGHSPEHTVEGQAHWVAPRSGSEFYLVQETSFAVRATRIPVCAPPDYQIHRLLWWQEAT